MNAEAIIPAVAATLVILGAIWKAIRGVTKNADAWDIVKSQLLANSGHSLIDRVGKIEERLSSLEGQGTRIETATATIDRKVTP